MSAWMCSPQHLSALVDAIHTFELQLDGHTKPDTFRLLHLENQRSLHARYGSPIHEDLQGQHYERGPELRPEDYYMLARSYAYQSCEHDQWHDSQADDLVDAVIHQHILRNHGGDDVTAWDHARDVNGLWSI